MSGISPASSVGFFPLRLVTYDPTRLPFQWEEGEAEAETMGGGELEIPPEAEASMVEALGGRVEVDCSGGPLLAEASRVEAPLWVHLAVLKVVVVTEEATIPLLAACPTTWLQVAAKAVVVTGIVDGAPDCRAAPKHLQ